MEKKGISIKTQASNQDSDHRKGKRINSSRWKTEVRFHLGSILIVFYQLWLGGSLSHDCIFGSDFFQHFKCQMNYDTAPFLVGAIELFERYWKIFLCDDIQVKHGTEQMIEAKLENGFEHNTNTRGTLEE